MITPVKGKAKRKRFSTSLKKINQKYGRVLKRLAEPCKSIFIRSKMY